jgi:hypothetical protein
MPQLVHVAGQAAADLGCITAATAAAHLEVALHLKLLVGICKQQQTSSRPLEGGWEGGCREAFLHCLSQHQAQRTLLSKQQAHTVFVSSPGTCMHRSTQRHCTPLPPTIVADQVAPPRSA